MSAGVVIADVSVRARESGSGIEVRFEFPTTGEIVRLPLPDRRPLEAVRRKAGTYLERAVPMAARLNATTGQAAETLRVLLNAGGSLTELLAPNRAHFLSLQDAFRAAWPLWESWADPDSPLPIVQMDCHDETLPLELLPVFDYGALPPLRTYDELARAAARFLGARGNRRRRWGGVRPSRAIVPAEQPCAASPPPRAPMWTGPSLIPGRIPGREPAGAASGPTMSSRSG